MLRCVRTTLSLDDDVAAALDRLRKRRGESFKELVNNALRRGLQQLQTPTDRPPPFRTEAVDLGRCRLGSLDNVAEALAIAEGEGYR